MLEPYVQLEEVFVECFLTAPRSTSYSTHFNSKRNDWFKLVHPEGKLLTILQEVCVCACMCVCMCACVCSTYIYMQDVHVRMYVGLA